MGYVFYLKRIACASYKQHLVREREELCWLPGHAVCDNGRNALFLTHFLSFCIPSSQKKKRKKEKNKNDILLDCIILLVIFSLKVHVIKE